MTNQTPKLNPAEGDEKTPAEEKRGGGGFVFHCALAGHTEVRDILPLRSGVQFRHCFVGILRYVCAGPLNFGRIVVDGLLP
jgi:hypothetical protein